MEDGEWTKSTRSSTWSVRLVAIIPINPSSSDLIPITVSPAPVAHSHSTHISNFEMFSFLQSAGPYALEAQLKGHSSGINSLDVSPGGDFLASASKL
jgi:hypothetical protein